MSTKLFLLFLFSLFQLCSCSVPTVPSLNITAYIGRWYQVYADAAVTSTFEKDAVCVTTDYGLLNSTYISVFNANRHLNVSGEIQSITGYAYIQDQSEPGKLKLHLDNGSPLDGDYYILQLGPINDAGVYAYSIVSDPLLLQLYVLARDVSDFEKNYESSVLAAVDKLGFNKFYNKPEKTLQDGCTYPWQPSKPYRF